MVDTMLYTIVTYTFIMCTVYGSDNHQLPLINTAIVDTKEIVWCHLPDMASSMNVAKQYINYGCHCGLDPFGTAYTYTPVDAIDRCCQSHDSCYKRVADQCTTGSYWQSSWDVYVGTSFKYNCTDKHIAVCDPNMHPCDYTLCQCDVNFGACLAQHVYPANGKPGCSQRGFVANMFGVFQTATVYTAATAVSMKNWWCSTLFC